jgi:glycosyltransferase involved in cell wall biosynthesis
MAKIAYFYREMSEYIEIDLRLLRERHTVRSIGCPGRWPRPLATWRWVKEADAVMGWFASWHALLPALFARLQKKPFVLVVGGYDTACLPGIDYGHQRGGPRAAIARAVLSLATSRVAISEFTMRELQALGFGGEADPLIPLGLDPTRYACATERDPHLVVTVGGVYRNNLARKGLEVFVRAAARCLGQQFVLVGPWRDDAIEHLRAIGAPNVTFTGELSHADKVNWLARAAVVVQASQHEAFGLSLAEGMLCGAVPVVTNAGALPWVAGGTGVVVSGQDPAALALGIRSALAMAPQAGQAARARVLAEFTVARRGERLHALLAAHGIGQNPAGARDEHRRAA